MGATQRKPPHQAWAVPLGLIAAGVLLVVAAAAVSAGQPSEARLTVVTSDLQGVEFVFDTPRSSLSNREFADEEALAIAGEGFSPVEPGVLPERGTLIGVPPGVAVSLEFEIERESALNDATLTESLSPDLDLSDLSAAEITDEAWLRDLRVVRVAIRPLTIGADGNLVLRRRIRARLLFEGTPSIAASRPDPYWDRAYSRLVSNWPQAAEWRIAAGESPTREPNPLAAEGAWKVAVDQAGWQLVPASSLIMSGLPPGAHPSTVRVFDNNVEIPLYIIGGEDGRLDGGDEILFYGLPVDNRYADTNIYWLSVDTDEAGVRIGDKAAAPGSGTRPDAFTDTLKIEEDLFYDPLTPSAPDEDRFYWHRLITGGNPLSATVQISFTLAGLMEGPAEVRMRLKGENDAGHRVRLTLNGTEIADRLWTGTEPLLLVEPLADSTALVDGVNALVVNSISSGPDSSLLDWIELDFPKDFDSRGNAVVFNAEYDATHQITNLPDNDVQVLDVTDPGAALNLTDIMVAGIGPYLTRFDCQVGHRYLVAPAASRIRPVISLDTPADLVNPGAGVDIILLGHTDFRIAAVWLRSHRFQELFRTKIFDVQDAFDTYSDGEPDPGAIRAMVARAYTGWPAPAPSYLLLIGDGHYDYRNFVAENRWFIPPAMAEPGPEMGETASDNWYVTVSGDDIVPDMAVGRLPVNHRTAASDASDRIRTYEQQPVGPWQDRALMVADAGPQGADPGERYSDRANDVARELPQRFSVQRLVYGQLGYQSPAAVRSTVTAALGNGRALLGYLGTANRSQWSNDGIWRIDEVVALDNQDWPVVLDLTGNTGYFVDPGQRSLAEEFVDREDGGAIASWSATGPYDGPGLEKLGSSWVRAVYDDGYRGGSAAMVAKVALFASAPELAHLVETLTWLGDPALVVAGTIPRDPASPTPVVTLAPTGTSTPSATVTASATLTPTITMTPSPSSTGGTIAPTFTPTATGGASPTTGTPPASATPGATTATPGQGTLTPGASPTATEVLVTPTPTSGPSPTSGPTPIPTATSPYLPGEGSAIYIPVAFKP